MDLISLTCPKCKTLLEFPADQAGNEGECVVCGADVPIPRTLPRPADNDEDGNTGYGLVDVVKEKKKVPVEAPKKKKKEVIDPSLRRKKKLQDADKWHVVRGGLTVMSTAAAAWGLIYALQMAVVLFGCTLPWELNPARIKVLERLNKVDDLDEGVKISLDRPRFALSLLYGTEYLTAFQTVQVLLALLSIFPVVLFVLGYFACSRSPNRFGMHQQVKAMTILAFVNAGILLLFKILPLTTVMPYTPLPYFVPELATLNANVERVMPIPVLWTQFSFVDYLLTFLFIGAKAAECALGGIFICTMGFTIKDEALKGAGAGLVQLALGTGFAFIVYHFFSICGSSNVLVDWLRFVYLFAVFLQFFFIIRYMLVLNQACATLDKKMEDMTEEELRWKDEDDPVEDDDDDDEDEAPKKKKTRKGSLKPDDDDDEAEVQGKSKRKRDDDEEEDDDRGKRQRKRDDDEDDGDEDDDDRPRKRKKR